MEIYYYPLFKEFEFEKVNDNGHIYFEYTINLAPENLPEVTFDDLIKDLTREIKILQRFKSLLLYSAKKATIECQYDFYWKDRDLLIRIVVSGDETRLKLKP